MNPSTQVSDHRLKDFCLVGDGTHSSIARQDKGIQYLSSKNFKSTGLDLSKVDFISKVDYEKHFKKSRSALVKPSPRDVLFGIIGSIGTPYIVRPKDQFGISSSVAILRPGEKLDSGYLYYYMTSRSFQSAVESIKSGVAQGFLSLEMIRNLPLIKFDLSTQRKIAAILTAYDDLIETNGRRIALLEQMAEELYREWFVRLRFPGHHSTKFIKGIPEGWKIRELKECAEVNPASLGRNDRPETIHYIDIRSVTTNQIGDIQTLSLTEAPGRAKRRVQHGDIIWSSVRPANRAYCLIYQPIENLIASTGFAVIRPKPETPFTFLNFAVTSNGFVDQMTAVAKGAAYPATSFDDFEKAKLLWPSESLIAEFHQNCEPLFHQKHTLTEQNRNLTRTRDLLLPRLISGKLSVEDLDIQFPPSMRED